MDIFEKCYAPTLASELKEKGVTTLILHEKWNKCQNWFELSEFTARQLRTIVDECHQRGHQGAALFRL